MRSADETMEILPPPTPIQFLVSIAWGVGIGLSLIAISGGANRSAHRSVGLTASIHRFVAYSTLGIGVVWLGVIGFSLIYPHHHHDVQWLEGGRSINYAVDAAIGLASWIAAWLVYRLGWKRPLPALTR